MGYAKHPSYLVSPHPPPPLLPVVQTQGNLRKRRVCVACEMCTSGSGGGDREGREDEGGGKYQPIFSCFVFVVAAERV